MIISVTSGDNECSEENEDHSTTWEQEKNEESQVVVTGKYVREWRYKKEKQENDKEDHGKKEEDGYLGEERTEKNLKEEKMREERSTREEEMKEERSTRKEEDGKEYIDNEEEDMSPARKYPRMFFCWNCGVRLQNDANSVVMKFCWKCGVRLLQIFH